MNLKFLAMAAAATLLPNTVSAQEIIGNLKVYRGANSQIWLGQIKEGSLTHLESAVVFPDAYGDFKRNRIMAVDDGKDVMIHYVRSRSEGDVELSVFLFMPDDLPEHRLTGALQSLPVDRPGQFIWTDGPFDVVGATPLRLFKGTYKTGIGPNTLMDYLYFGKLGKWTVKVRATLPSTKSIEDEKSIDALVRNLPWEGILAANGECLGSACVTAPSMPFNHHIGESMLGSLLKAMKAKKPGGDPVAPLFSRKEGGQLWEVHTLPDLFAPLFQDSYGGLSVKAPIYSLSRKNKKSNEIVRFFSGTPDQALFDKTVDMLQKHPEMSAFTASTLASHYVIDE